MFDTIAKLRHDETLEIKRTEYGAYLRIAGVSSTHRENAVGIQVANDAEIDERLPEALSTLRGYTNQPAP